MKRIFLSALIVLPLFFGECKAEKTTKEPSGSVAVSPVIYLTNESFKKLVFNYDAGSVFKFEGTRPVIIDFYADWCAPCRQLSPIVEEIAKEYSGKIVVYKVDTEKEMLLSQKLGITGLPTLLFVPVKGEPRVSMGVIPKESLVKAINEILLIK